MCFVKLLNEKFDETWSTTSIAVYVGSLSNFMAKTAFMAFLKLRVYCTVSRKTEILFSLKSKLLISVKLSFLIFEMGIFWAETRRNACPFPRFSDMIVSELVSVFELWFCPSPFLSPYPSPKCSSTSQSPFHPSVANYILVHAYYIGGDQLWMEHRS